MIKTKRPSFLSILIGVVLVVLISLPGVADLFKPGYYTSHDGEGHVIRMDEFYRAFQDGQLPVRWSPRLYFGYGYPFFNFNYPSVYYFGVPIMALGFDATAAMKVETIATFLLSGVVMFLYLRRKVSSPAAVIGTVLYLYAPYRLLNIYVRGSVAEAAAFMFPPLLLWAAEAVAAKRALSTSLAALLLFLLGISHNISALLLFGLFFAYSLFLSLEKKSVMPLVRSFIAWGLGLMMAAFFFIPALLEKKFTFLDTTIAKDYPDHFISLAQFVKAGWDFGASVAGPNDGLSFNLGWVALVMTGLGFSWLAWRAFRRSKKKSVPLPHLTLWLFGGLVLIGSVLLMLPFSKPLWDHLPLLPFVQFPWRFIMLTVPILSVLSALTAQHIFAHFDKLKWLGTAVMVSVIGITLYFAKDQWHRNQVLWPQTIAGDALLGSTTWADEQATQWFLPKPSAIPTQKITAVEETSNLAFTIDTWKTGLHQYQLTVTEPATIIENTMYYPGWIAKVDGQPTEIQFENSRYPGRITFSVPAGQHTVTTQMQETPLRLSMDLLSLVTFLAISGRLGYWAVTHLRKSQSDA